MRQLSIGDKVGIWHVSECICCNRNFHVTRTQGVIIKSDDDLTCSDCLDAAKHENEIDDLKAKNKSLIEANKELCSMLAKWHKADFTNPMLGITELKSATWDVILKHNN